MHDALTKVMAGALALAALTAAPVSASFSAASAGQAEPVYWIYYFSDASKTTQVGFIEQYCDSWGVGERAPVGQITPYEERILLGHCLNGQLVWLPDEEP